MVCDEQIEGATAAAVAVPHIWQINMPVLGFSAAGLLL
jgi:hypothetical protein